MILCHFVLLFVSFLLVCPTFDCLLVLVNRMKVAQVLTSMHNKISKDLEYHYEPGDRVDISCVRQHDNGKIRLNFDYAKRPLVDYSYNPDDAARGDEWPTRAVGLELVLLKEHDQQQLSCEYEEFRDESVATATVNFKFIINSTTDDVMYFKLNGRIFRLQNLAFYTSFYNKYDSTLQFESVITREGVAVESDWEYFDGRRSNDVNNTDKNSPPDKTNIIIYKNLDFFQSLVFKIRYLRQHRHSRQIKVDFSQLTDYKSLGDGNALKLIIPTYDNVALVSYRWLGDSIYYYEYEYGHSVNLTCEAGSKLMSTDRYVLNFDGVLTRSDSMTKHIQLGAADDRSTFVCSLIMLPEATVRKMYVVFQSKSLMTRVTTTTKTTNLPTTSISTPKSIKTTTTAPETTTIPTTTAAVGIITTSRLPTTNSPETSSTPVTTLIIVIAAGAALIALSVACVVWYVRRKKVCATMTGHPLIENETTASVMEHQLGATNETYHSAPYAYVYASGDEAVTTIPRYPHTSHSAENSAHPEVYRPPSYDYAYCRPPQRPCTSPPPEQPRNSMDSDYTDHYTEIDDYFIQKQMEKRMKRKQVRLL